ncbi:vacuolar protein sorting-associated protein 35 [Dictyocaulus viviparus]|uniref:Vacuolar protein sorting-associated protein 35 n=1 Tax=Dictyocaulus viviparus TaxID=29172 RepID=A0A0D8Y535_DICVI|nr:vacuolar protein sorting-associated protein 35 [Dictyocaulus viviparus]
MKNEAAINSEQEKLLENATRVVKTESLEMKRCLDKGETMDALKHASQFLSELKTSELSPKFYYRLYMDAVSELQHLESFLVDEHERGERKIEKLYEFVQYAGSIIPRLYLLITIGVVYIKCGEDTRRNILSDLVEMCRGVQNPLRGLFLRNYLLQSTRTLLPDVPDMDTADVILILRDHFSVNDLSESDKAPRECDGTVSDAVHFVLVNFAEMNKLWVRMQHQGPSREREKREKDRMELRILVGTNLVRLSQLENLKEQMYVKEVLPSILEQVVSCRDRISQIHLFDIFSDQVKSLVKNHPDMLTEDIVSLYAALVNLAVKCYQDRPEFANTTFGSLKCILEERKRTAVDPFDAVGRELMKLIRLPVDVHNNALKVAELTEFVPVMECFKYHGRCLASSYIIQNMLENETFMRTEEDVAVMCAILHSVLVDQQDQPLNATLLNNARKILGAGGTSRIKFTLAPIVFELYKLILRFVHLKDEGAMVADKVPLSDSASVVYEFISKAMSVFEDELSESRERLNAMILITGTMLHIGSLPSENWHTLAGQIVIAASAKMFKKADQARSLCAVASLYWKGRTAESDGGLRNGEKVVELLNKAAKIASQCLEPVVQQQLFIQIINTFLYYYEDGCLEVIITRFIYFFKLLFSIIFVIGNRKYLSYFNFVSLSFYSSNPVPQSYNLISLSIYEIHTIYIWVTEDILVELISRTKNNAVQLDVSAEADALEKHLAMTLQHAKQLKDKRPELAERLRL